MDGAGFSAAHLCRHFSLAGASRQRVFLGGISPRG
jgi:hypothetical protein